MKRIVISLTAVMLLTSCGHNAGGVVTGKYLNFGFDPDTGKFGICYGDGLIVYGAGKKNTEQTAKYTSEQTDKNGNTVRTTVEYGAKAGEQIDGYSVDAIKASKENNSND